MLKCGSDPGFAVRVSGISFIITFGKKKQYSAKPLRANINYLFFFALSAALHDHRVVSFYSFSVRRSLLLSARRDIPRSSAAIV